MALHIRLPNIAKSFQQTRSGIIIVSHDMNMVEGVNQTIIIQSENNWNKEMLDDKYSATIT